MASIIDIGSCLAVFDVESSRLDVAFTTVGFGAGRWKKPWIDGCRTGDTVGLARAGEGFFVFFCAL